MAAASFHAWLAVLLLASALGKTVWTRLQFDSSRVGRIGCRALHYDAASTYIHAEYARPSLPLPTVQEHRKLEPHSFRAARA